MINEFNLAKALRDKAQEIATANSYTLVANGEGFAPEVGETYIEEIVLYGNNDTIGMPNDSSDIQIGIYQININTPINESKWAGLAIVNVINPEFPKGLKLTFGGQLVVIKTTTLEPMQKNDTHLIHILSISFSVIN
jgi:hypothetical protein